MGNAQMLCLSADMEEDLNKRPVAIVLGAAVWPDGQPSPTLRRRALYAAKLWQAGEVGAIIGSGGLGQYPPSEAEVIAQLCREAGVPAPAILQEDQATTTEENLRFSKAMMAATGFETAIIVTDRYHAPRARLVARRLGIKARASCPAMAGTAWHRVVKSWLREIPAYLWYLLRGKGRG